MDEQALVNSIYESKKIKSLQTRFIFYLILTNIFTFLVATFLVNEPKEITKEKTIPLGHKEIVVSLKPQIPMDDLPKVVTLYSTDRDLVLQVTILDATTKGNGLFQATLAVPEKEIEKIIENSSEYFLAYPEHKTADSYELIF